MNIFNTKRQHKNQRFREVQLSYRLLLGWGFATTSSAKLGHYTDVSGKRQEKFPALYGEKQISFT